MKTALFLAASLAFMCLPAHAYEVESGAVTICDTQDQVERYAQLFDGNPQVAISAVNTEQHDPNACALVDVSYVLGPQLGVARGSAHAFHIIPIVVIAVSTPNGYRPAKPALFFAPVKIAEFAV
jgi:hypothetical protein